MSLWLVLTALSAVPFALAAPPTLLNPIAGQLPRIARVNQSYSWQPWTSTFSLDSSTGGTATTISYSLDQSTQALPSWLTFNNGTAGFTGTPSETDVGLIPITLVATNPSDGTSTKDEFSLYVSSGPSPAVHYGLGTQIADPTLHEFSSVSILPSLTGILVQEYYSFSLGFQWDTFRPAYGYNTPIYYTARARGSTTLPDWLVFDNTTMTFGSQAAPAASQSLVVVLVGTDVWGYSAVESTFQIEVGTQSLDLVKGVPGFGNLTAVAGQKVELPLNVSALMANGKPVTSALTIQPNLTLASWLSFDDSTATLSGTVPSTYINGTQSPIQMPISISTTINGTKASYTTFLPISIYPSLFKNVQLTATANSSTSFDFALTPYIRDPSKVSSINATFTPSGNWSSWLQFNSNNLSLTGTLPQANNTLGKRAVSDAQIQVVFEAVDSTTDLPSYANLNVDLVGYTAPPSTATPTASSGSGKSSGDKHSGLSKGGKIALGVVFGLLGLILATILIFCCVRRRQQRKEKKREMPRKSTDGDSFIGGVKSPAHGVEEKHSRFIPFSAPRSPSARLQNGESPVFQSIFVHQPSDVSGQGSPMSMNASPHQPQSPPRRMGAMNGILSWGAMSDGRSKSPKPEEGHLTADIPDILPASPVPGEIIRQGTPVAGSDFSHSFNSGSSSSGSRASWESPESFHWSSAENHHQRLDVNGRPISHVPSIPRPRADFAPRYPRTGSPTTLSRLARPPSETLSQQTFSEFNHDRNQQSDDYVASTSFGAGSGSMSGSQSGPNIQSSSSHSISRHAPTHFAHGPSGLGRIIGDNGHIEEDDSSHPSISDDGSVVVTEARRESLDRQPRLMPSRERFAQSPTHEELLGVSKTPSEEAIALDSAAFDDAEEGSRSRPQSTAYAPSRISDVQGLGYPSEAIYFGSPPPARGGQRISSIRAVSSPGHERVQSPPLPHSDLVARLAANRRSAVSANSVLHEGRYIAQANENFNLHPHVNPPPTVTLSASTWSSNPRSTYRAEQRNGQPLPKWLHWDAKELELWGIPSLNDAGQVTDVRIVETMPREKRNSHEAAVWIASKPNEREVGACTIEVIDGMRSPDAFHLEDYAPVAL